MLVRKSTVTTLHYPGAAAASTALRMRTPHTVYSSHPSLPGHYYTSLKHKSLLLLVFATHATTTAIVLMHML